MDFTVRFTNFGLIILCAGKFSEVILLNIMSTCEITVTEHDFILPLLLELNNVPCINFDDIKFSCCQIVLYSKI